ncbi:two-component system sensor histidine kinase PmrB [Tatumella sp. UBA2305]|uniref:two-component system sensor histidine kinase PmrB n=1 Tax=Tatumella sp. UBA2305 TaxID=1947647 RepID=UPI0025CFA4CF|nr:two-component system sensor histidine kinase PmrB [Tatumella sp. UBA2305]
MKKKPKPTTLRRRLLISLGAILLFCQAICVLWLWHESKEQIDLLVTSVLQHRNEQSHVEKEIHDAVASLALPSLIMISVALLLCWQAVKRITRPLTELRFQLEKRTEFNLQPIEYQSAILEVDAVIHSINDMVERMTATLARERLFTADVAHELRTPLAGLRLHLELIAKQQHIDMSALILRLDQMTSSVSQLLQLARIGQSFDAGNYQQVPLVSAVTEPLRDSLLTMIKLRHQHLILPEQPADYEVKGDPTLIQLVVRNLVENAHRYSPEHTTLQVSVQRVTVENGSPQIELAVEDEGPGIDESKAGELSKAFSRMDSRYGGIGLGLSIVSRICQLHGASFYLANRTDKQGCRATVRFNGPASRTD